MYKSVKNKKKTTYINFGNQDIELELEKKSKKKKRKKVVVKIHGKMFTFCRSIKPPPLIKPPP